ncbi:LacI family transcriptional regulator [Brachybacterium phenoliresistens]|uniref:LacI family transcriptional regulator n=1 Tax=Brachybacterium phenoliresistens TaxID=396014 RepID=Z9JQ40_9MICO|nr:LacI family DNA-binding transcriptional regulator [Brachybacterium phenoliresistens]EWS80123.1 LacI family transcriptional regulator [Brachybacterium phenoliresistens]
MTSLPRRPSMTDVADRAGVSYQTVSRVLNDPHRVKPATRERVQAAIEELGFTRNRAARALRTTRSRIIGVLTDGSSLYGPATTLSAVEAAAHEAGYTTLLASVGPHGASGERTGRELLESGADGIIVIAPHEGMVPALEAIARTTPIVSVTAGAPAIPGATMVTVDQARGARSVVEHLAEAGCRSVVHLQGPPSWFDARGRRAGFVEAVDQLGLDAEITEPGDWSPGSGARIAEALLRGPLPDAVFAANDHMALGLLHVLHARGVRVPEQVAVVGFDDISGAAYFTPSLSTVRQPFDRLGQAAVARLISGLGPAPEEAAPAAAPSGLAADLAPELIVRRSSSLTAPATTDEPPVS